MTLCLATHNAKKAAEMRVLLAPLGYEVKSLKDLGVTEEPEENGETFAENAMIKASAACKATGLTAVADDSGLCVDALDGAPGIFSARFGGLATEGERNGHLLRLMEGKADRGAHFACAIVLYRPDGSTLLAEGECRGEILTAPKGVGGFGYDPLFWLPEMGRSMAELSPAEKDAVSHRGVAMRRLYRMLECGG